jgi:predicted HAD superfamily Cof-like phosphohydrolase
MDGFHDVGQFHAKFGLDNIGNGIGPRQVSPDLMNFRLKFLQEELNELQEGVDENNIEKIADALIDLVYVAYGTAHLLGLPWAELWWEVQKANMTKQRAMNAGESKRGSEFDVIKPAGWKPPNLLNILRRYGWQA